MTQQQRMQQMQQEQQEEQEQMRIEIVREFEQNPRNSIARYKMAWFTIRTLGMEAPIKPGITAADLLLSCLNLTEVYPPLQEADPMFTFMASGLLGRFYYERSDLEKSARLLRQAFEISKSNSHKKEVGEICTHMQLATHLEMFPKSNEHVDRTDAKMEEYATSLLDLYHRKHPDAKLNMDFMAMMMPGFANDPFVHCHLSLFYLSFHYRADVARIANLFYRLATTIFPNLLRTAKHVKRFEEEQKRLREQNGIGDESGGIIQTCVNRKIKLGVVCAVLSEGHSVSDDFGGVLQRLDRDVFNVTYIYVHEKSTPQQQAKFLTANPQDRLFHFMRHPQEINGDWIPRFANEIENFEFDTILYPDMTMSTYSRRLAIGRLAPVQLNSHGHPITSGIPRHTVQHFVSWAEAELPLEQSQTHYTEELQLIPKGKIHQYYTPRVDRRSNGEAHSGPAHLRFDHLGRDAFPELPEAIRNTSPEDEDIHIYVCMQKPFKLFPEFDELVCGVLEKDPLGHAILHKDDLSGNTERFNQRMITAGCDMNRVHFVSSQPHHLLMALYQTSSVILDSYPAGGCTTTREALELGKVIVTWPARLLGGRWTLGLYNAISLDEESKGHLIADSKEEYIAKAVELGTNNSLRKSVESKILEVIPNLFGRWEAVEEWQKILTRVSPVKQCSPEENREAESIPEGNDEL